jgi:CHASE2 domain-containing sensor protein
VRYHNFDLEVYSESEGAYLLSASAADSLRLGEARGKLPSKSLDAFVDEAQVRLAIQRTDRQFLTKFGSDLYEVLFQGEIGRLFENCWGAIVRDPEQGLRIRFKIEPPRVASLPWEFLYWPSRECFLGASIRTALTRYPALGQPNRPLDQTDIAMLLVIPNSPGLNVEKERANLCRTLEDLKNVDVKILAGNVTREQIGETLIERKFHLFHFIGHGDYDIGRQSASIQLNTVDGEPDYIDEEAFSSLFENHMSMKLVVLNSCKGAEVSAIKPLLGMAPQLMKKGIPAVVAMQYAIHDDVAIAFARCFYHSLLRGTDAGRVEVAISHARSALGRAFPDERAMGTPVLFMRAPEGMLFDLTSRKLISRPFSQALSHSARALSNAYEQHIADAEKVGGNVSEVQYAYQRLRRRITLRRVVGLTSVVVIFLLSFLAFMKVFDLFTLDTKIETYTLWLADFIAQRSLSEDIALVAITTESEESLNKRYDAMRAEHALLIDKLSLVGAKVIVFDMFFDSPSTDDETMASAILRARDRGTEVAVSVNEFVGDKPKLNTVLEKAISSWGIACIGKKLAYARSEPIVAFSATTNTPSLAMTAVALYQKRSIQVNPQKHTIGLADLSKGTIANVNVSEVREVRSSQSGCPAIRAGDKVASLIINFSSRAALNAQTTPYHKIVTSADPAWLARFKNKVVLVGTEKKGLDSFPAGFEERYGLEIHADIVNTLLRGSAVRPLGLNGQIVTVAFMSILAALSYTFLSTRKRLGKILFVSLVTSGYFIFTVFACLYYDIMSNPLYPISALFVTYWTIRKLRRSWS